MIYVFLGNEISILKNKINELIKKLNISNIIKYEYDETSIIDILNELNYVDLFNEKKLIIVNNFTFKGIKEKEEKILSNYINNMSDNVLILKCKDESLDSRKSIIKLLKEKCKVEELKKLDYKGLHDLVTKIFKENGINVTYNQVKKILEMTENNTDVTLLEVNKLLTYIDDNRLTDEIIDKVVSTSNEKEMFRLNDAVMNKDIAKIFESYKIILSSGVDSIAIIDFLSKQFRTLYQVKILSKSKNPDLISKELGIKPYVIKKMYDIMNNFKEEEIINIMYKLSDMDIDIKVNSLDKDKLLEMFFLNI